MSGDPGTSSGRVPGETDKSERLKKTFFFILLTLITLLVILVARNFFQPVLLAAISAGLVYPLDRKIMSRLSGNRNIAAGLSLLLACFIIIVPVAVAGYFVVDNIVTLSIHLGKNTSGIRSWFNSLEESLRILPIFQNPRMAEILSFDRFADMIQKSGTAVLENLADLAGNTARAFFLLFIYLYCLFFFIRDGKQILAGMASALPLAEEDKRIVIDRFLSVTRSTLKSTFIIGSIQGTIGGLLFFFLGIAAPVLWGIGFFILAAVPGLGAVVIWLPATVILLITGEPVKAVIMLAIGGAVIPLADYMLRPRIVGQDTRLHPVLVFIGVLGGVAAFGIWGLLFGPLVMSLAVTIWGIFTRLFSQELEQIRK